MNAELSQKMIYWHTILLNHKNDLANVIKTIESVEFGGAFTCAYVWALYYEQRYFANILLSKNIDCTLTFGGDTLLHVAVKYGNLKDLDKLLELGADIESVNDDEYTPAWLAVKQNNLSMLMHLHSRGARINQIHNDGKIIFHLAAECGANNCIPYIYEHIQCINHMDIYGKTPIYMAAQYENITTVFLLAQLGGDITIKTLHGDTVLHLACCFNNMYFVQYALNLIDVNTTNLSGHTPLHYAKYYSRWNIQVLLCQNGANNE